MACKTSDTLSLYILTIVLCSKRNHIYIASSLPSASSSPHLPPMPPRHFKTVQNPTYTNPRHGIPPDAHSSVTCFTVEPQPIGAISEVSDQYYNILPQLIFIPAHPICMAPWRAARHTVSSTWNLLVPDAPLSRRARPEHSSWHAAQPWFPPSSASGYLSTRPSPVSRSSSYPEQRPPNAHANSS